MPILTPRQRLSRAEQASLRLPRWPAAAPAARIARMTPPTQMIKFALKIRTRSGLPVENLLVQARDRSEAERRITQMYPHCEILECREVLPTVREDDINFENIISMISRTPEDKD
jgi:hypothetical protein